jgi:hypothetical protein
MFIADCTVKRNILYFNDSSLTKPTVGLQDPLKNRAGLIRDGVQSAAQAHELSLRLEENKHFEHERNPMY